MIDDRTSANLVNKTDVSPFDSIRHFDGNNKEFWTGRELQKLLGYSKWESFGKTIRKASFSCQNAGNPSSEHFFPFTGKIESKAGRTAEDWKLTRFACYLVAQNGDPEKPEIAAAQSYFAIKTREAETQQTAPPKSQAEIILAQAQQLVEHEQRLARTEQRLKVIEQRSIDAVQTLALLPAPTEPAPPLTERASLRQLINKWCDATNVDQHLAWTKLYSELYYRDGFNVTARMKKGKYATKLDLIVDSGKLSVLYAIAQDIFGSTKGSIKCVD